MTSADEDKEKLYPHTLPFGMTQNDIAPLENSLTVFF
jgi:hypothetical protein